jgi:glycerol kinase
MSVLVVDVGTSGVRAAVVRQDASVGAVQYREVLPVSPAQGFVEFDALEMAAASLEVARAALAEHGPVSAVGIANQRASTIVWDRRSGEPVGPGIGWQDLRTVGMCMMLREQGVLLGPNESATKLVMLLDLAGRERSGELCFGTIDTWIAWTLSGGGLHVTDRSNAGITGLTTGDGMAWDEQRCEQLGVPLGVLPQLVDSYGFVGPATELEGSPPITGMAGDQQASLVGQGCLRPGLAKATFGTGGMLDCCVGGERPAFDRRGHHGTFPIVAWSGQGTVTWGLEAVMLSAGTCVEWLRDDLGLVATAADTEAVAASVPDTAGAWFVPALLGLGTPVWDFGARGTLVGLTRGTTRAHVVRAVLEGIAHRGADLLEAVEADSGLTVEALRVDGGMSANSVFTQALADATGRAVEIASVTEATTIGAALLAGTGAGVWASLDEATSLVSPRAVIEPRRRLDRERWLEARARAERTVPELSTLDF